MAGSKKKEKSAERRRMSTRAVVATVLTIVVAPILILFLTPIVTRAGQGLVPQLESSVAMASEMDCNFVVPLDEVALEDPTLLALEPGTIPAPGHAPAECDDVLATVGGVRERLMLEAVLAPSGDAAVVLTDITVDVRERQPTTGSAFYTPYGTGGPTATTLTVDLNVEATKPVQGVTVYATDGTSTYSSIREVQPRVAATQAEPLDLLLSISGKKSYTTFDIVLHWQTGTTVGTTRLDNGGLGYQVAGTDRVPALNGFNDDGWQMDDF